MGTSSRLAVGEVDLFPHDRCRTLHSHPGGSPVYSDYEDGSIGGNLRVTGLSSCWFGALRLQIGGSFTYTGNSLADPDASENLTNHVGGNILCSDNSPAVQLATRGAVRISSADSPRVNARSRPTAPNPGVPPGSTDTHLGPESDPSPVIGLGAQDGGIFSFGVALLRLKGGQPLPSQSSASGPSPGGIGYNLADANGTVYRFGAQALDCTGVSGPLNQPVVGIATAPGGMGAGWRPPTAASSRSGPMHPSSDRPRSLSLNKPVVGIAATPG